MISIVNTECHVPKTFSDLAKIAAWGRLGQFVRWIVDVASNYDNAGEECATFMALASEVGSAPGAPSIFQKLLGDIQSPVATAS